VLEDVIPRATHIRKDGEVVVNGLPPIPAEAGDYFRADTSAELISVIMNDWPYSGLSHNPGLPSLSITPVRSPTRYRARSGMDPASGDTLIPCGPSDIRQSRSGRTLGVYWSGRLPPIPFITPFLPAFARGVGDNGRSADQITRSYCRGAATARHCQPGGPCVCAE
jgi:hypothetical protein